MSATENTVFGRLLTAMITPFDGQGQIAYDVAERLADYLVTEQDHDAIVVNGTTGESPTTSDVEKAELIRVVKSAVAGRAQVVAGVGTFSTEHTVSLSRAAQTSGADGLLVVTPYYSRPPQDALKAHFTQVADATDLPVMLYDIPKRAGVPIESGTLIELAAHPQIVAVKDAKGDPVASSQVMAATDLAYYAGDDAITLSLLAVGAVGLVGTSTHFTGRLAKQMIEAFVAGDHDRALSLHRLLLPVFTGVFATQGNMLVKAGLNATGWDVGGLRAPLLAASDAEAATFVRLLGALNGE